MLDFELKLAKPRTLSQWISALSMGLSYLLGGLVLMVPYFTYKDVDHALFRSIRVTVVVLMKFGYTKPIVTGCNKKDAVAGSLQTLPTGPQGFLQGRLVMEWSGDLTGSDLYTSELVCESKNS
jgi:hypothetical protein